MQIEVLGALRVLEGDRAIDPGPAKQRQLLAMLAVARGRAVPGEVLIDQLWGEAAPASAQGTLQGYIANLRRALEPDRPPRAPARVLVSEPTGYALVVDEDGLDADRFERLARRGHELLDGGDAEAAAEALREALALWRGPPLADAAGGGWAAAEIVRLTELHIAATEDLADARLALGEHDHLVGDLQQLLAANPLRERLRGQLMLALYRAGRQADALGVCREGRDLLAEELGIDPSPALRQLEADILRQAGHLTAPLPPGGPATEVLPPTGRGGPGSQSLRRAGPRKAAQLLVGRDAEMGILEHVLAGTEAGVGHVVLLSGEPGIGKTRLVEELGRRASSGRVVQGRCVEAEGVPPFWPWVQVLGALPQPMGAGDMSSGVDDLAPAASARFGQALQVAARLRAAAASRATVVVLEDIHWADPASLDLLHLVADQLVDDPVLIAATYRDVDVRAGGALEEALGLLARHPAVTHLALRGLDEEAVRALAEQATGVDPDVQGSRALHERTGGNPFFVTELLRWSSTSPTHTSLPAGVRDVLRLRLAGLPQGATRGLTIGAVIGRDFPLTLVEGVVADDEGDVLTGVEAAVEAGLVREPAAGVFRFSHALVREVLLDGITAARRARLHGRILDVLRQRQGAHIPVHTLAHHAHAAALGGVEVPDAAVLCLREAREALSRVAYEDAAAAASRGLECTMQPPGGDPAVRCDLLLARAEALSRLGDLATAGTTVDEAHALAIELGDVDRIAQAALASAGGEFGLYWSIAWVGEAALVDTALPRLTEAHAVAGSTDAQTQIAIASLLAGNLALHGRAQEAEEVSSAALDRARPIGGLALAAALRGRLVARWYALPPEERIALADELIAVAGDHRTAELTGRFFRMHALLELGDVDGCDAELTRFEQRAAGLRMVEHELAAGWCRAQRALMEGRLEDVERMVGELAEPRPGATDAARLILATEMASVQGITLWLQGRLEEMAATAEQIGPDVHPAWRLITALWLAETGDATRAADLLAAAMPLEAPVFPEGIDALATAWLCAEVAVRVGDVQRARLLHRRLLPLADRLLVFSADATCHGSGELPLGSLAAACGGLDEAVERLRRAVHVNERVRALPYVALAHRRLAGVLQARGEARDVDEAAAHAATARRLADELRMPGVAGPWPVPALQSHPARP